jgi:LysR family transcriptional activator of nhaA
VWDQGSGAVVLADELREGLLASAPFNLEIVEAFYAVILLRRFPNGVVNELLGHARSLHARAPLV